MVNLSDTALKNIKINFGNHNILKVSNQSVANIIYDGC
jgi:hypothetical protein